MNNGTTAIRGHTKLIQTQYLSFLSCAKPKSAVTSVSNEGPVASKFRYFYINLY